MMELFDNYLLQYSFNYKVFMNSVKKNKTIKKKEIVRLISFLQPCGRTVVLDLQ